jgi:hypothetical protein
MHNELLALNPTWCYKTRNACTRLLQGPWRWVLLYEAEVCRDVSCASCVRRTTSAYPADVLCTYRSTCSGCLHIAVPHMLTALNGIPVPAETCSAAGSNKYCCISLQTAVPVWLEVLTAVTIKMAVFWVVAPCRLVSDHWSFRGLNCRRSPWWWRQYRPLKCR